MGNIISPLHSNADKHKCRDREEQAQVNFVVVDSYSNHGTNKAEDGGNLHIVAPFILLWSVQKYNR